MNPAGFFVEHWRYMCFGWLFTALSTLGSGYFIGLFGSSIRGEFGLSHADLGLIFAFTMLVSGPLLVWLGRMIDYVDLRLYCLVLCLGYAAGSLLIAASPVVTVLVIGLLFVRLIGDWLFLHTAVVSLARHFGNRRGEAMGIGGLGYGLGPAVFPLAAVLLMDAFGWRLAWAILAVTFPVAIMPVVVWLLHGKGDRHRQFLKPSAADVAATGKGLPQWSRREVLGDVRFYLVMPVVIALPFVLSGFVFHHVHLVETKGWSLAWFSSGFIIYAIGKVVMALVFGRMVDRHGSLRLLPYYPLPLVAGLLALAMSDHPWVVPVYLGGAGVSTGMWIIAMGALWAEMYGVTHLGGIRAKAQALMLAMSALAVFSVGGLLDWGVSMETIAWISIGYIAFSIALLSRCGRLPSTV